MYRIPVTVASVFFPGAPADGLEMSLDRWQAFLKDFRLDHPEQFFATRADRRRFAEFAGALAERERIALLLHAYGAYRSLALPPDDPFHSSCYSILISTLLGSGLRPGPRDAIAILRESFHRCGHGSDVEPPLTLAESAFAGQCYSDELFDAVLTYRETLRPMRGIHATNVKQKLNRVLWHDGRRVERSCHTRRIQLALNAMPLPERFRWQWLLRHTANGMQAGPGPGWLAEARQRLALLGEEEFLARLDPWFTFAAGPVKLGAPGGAVLRSLVWCSAVAGPERCRPVIARLAEVRWAPGGAPGRVMAALAWRQRTSGVSTTDTSGESTGG